MEIGLFEILGIAITLIRLILLPVTNKAPERNTDCTCPRDDTMIDVLRGPRNT